MPNSSWPLWLAFASGFFSLSQQILWVRLLGFFNYGKPEVFSAILAAFLAGIAAGAWLGRWCCLRQWPLYPLTTALLLLMGLSDLLLPELFASIYRSPLSNPLFYLIIFCTAAAKAVIFPLAHHLFTHSNSAKLGRSLAKIYFSNIAGSFLGPLLTGFVLLDLWSAMTIYRLTGLLELLLGALVLNSLWPGRWLARLSMVPLLLLAVLLLQHGSQLQQVLQDELLAPVNFLTENRQGIIHTRQDPIKGDLVYGGNLYDGRINVRLDPNSNKIDRVFLAAALHPQPKRVLMIGLSGGSWVRVIAALDTVKTLDVVELNPAYLTLIAQHQTVSSILTNAKVQIHIADGRKWLQQHNQRYDLIIMNNTFHWRAYSSNLLSAQMMALLQRRLAPGGLLAFNATGSANAHWTAAQQFHYSYRWSNFIYASNDDFKVTPEQIAARLMRRYRPDNWSAEQLQYPQLHNLFSQHQFIDIQQEAQIQQRKLQLITDDNMLPEYQPEH
jgi:spermidine synthase/uncharacterized protein (DUF2062 family)